MMHYLKCWNPYFEDMYQGKKNFEVRLNDRRFEEGDILIIWEYDKKTDERMSRHKIVEVTYVYAGDIGIEKGYVVLGIRDFSSKEEIALLEKD